MKRTLILLSAYQFLLEFITIYAIEKLFFLDSGLSIFQVSILNAVWGLSTLLFEIPTGVLADYWDRKKMLTSSGILLGFGYLLWLIFPSFWGFLLGLILRGLSLSFSSGTLQAYLYDHLSQNGEAEQFEKRWGRLKAMYFVGTGLGWIVGGILSEYSTQLLIVLSSLTGFLAALVSLLLPQLPKTLKVEEHPFAFLKIGLKFSLQNRFLLSSLLFSLIVWSSWFVLDEYWNVYLQWYGLSNAHFGLFVGSASLMGAVVGSFAHRLRKRVEPSIGVGVTFLGLTLLLSGFFPSPLWFFPLFFLESVMATLLVLQESVVQHHAPESHRATLASIQSLVKEFGIVSGFVFAYVWQSFGIQMGFAFFGGLMLLYLPFHFFLNAGK